ncbi:MAG: hypothetical protein LBI33_01425, partial [Propionibacteriaceae bacterium]|nr:hypothetical protein [Propionibacteriaceae bacterium]
QAGLISHNLALAVDGIFDHRQLSADHLLAEIAAWGLVSSSRAEVLVTDMLDRLAAALGAVAVPSGASPGMPDYLDRTVAHLRSGNVIGESQGKC